MANYMKVEEGHGGYIVEMLFVLNTYVTWPYMRLYIFPVHVIPGVVFGYHRLCCTICDYPGDPWKSPFPDLPGWYPWVLLVALFGLHVFWWFLMNKIAYKMVVKGKKPNKAGDECYEGSMKDK